VLIHFFASGRLFFLIISLGFTFQGAEDLIHALYSFSRIWSAERVGLTSFVPGTFIAGRLILIACFLLALYLRKAVIDTKKRKKAAILYNSFGFLLTIIATSIVINSPLPQFIQPGQIISRPVDFVAAIIYLFGFFLFVRVYLEKDFRTPFMWSLIASVIFGFVAQVYMVHSQQLYDALFDMSHVVKIFSYIFPIFGIAIGTFEMYKKEEELKQDLSESMEREKRSAAQAATLDAERKKTNELQKLKDELEIKVAERTKELQERISDLESFHDAAIDRELQMEEMRKRIKELEDQLKGQMR